jgi:hypothetical protein
MDPLRFDRLTRALGTPRSRRSALGGLLAGLLGPLLPATRSGDARPRKRCRGGKTRCGRRCVDLQTHPAHCGTCGHACPATATGPGRCQGGLCRCPGGILCGIDCVAGGQCCVPADCAEGNPCRTDLECILPQHTCSFRQRVDGTPCPGGVCCDGECVPGNLCCDFVTCGDRCCGAGQICCRNQCVTGVCCNHNQCPDPAAPICNEQHDCVECTTNQECVAAGKGTRCCDGECIARAECCRAGDCGDRFCLEASCEANQCVYRPDDDGRPCPGGVCCRGACRRRGQCCTADDCPRQGECRTAICRRNRCLYRPVADGTSCRGEGECKDGVCRCPRGTTDCGDGTCKRCCCPGPGPAFCSPICESEHETCCGFSCADTSTDPSNCGGCGETCRPGETCAAGECVCAPQCEGKVCGPNRCGGSCGSCPGKLVCNRAGTACICRTPSQCPPPSVCQQATCANGECGVRDAPNGTRCQTAQGSGICCGGTCEVAACTDNSQCPATAPVCSGGVCHHPYGCTAVLDACRAGNPQRCPDNPNGYCFGANGAQFCHGAPYPYQCRSSTQVCCGCPPGQYCVRLDGPRCCDGRGSYACLGPAPPP